MTEGLRWAREVVGHVLLALALLALFVGVTVGGVLLHKPAWFVGAFILLIVLLILGEGAFKAYEAAQSQAARTVTTTDLERWLEQRLAAAAVIKRQRPVRGDRWFIGAVGDWDTQNTTEMGLGEDPIAPDLVDSYRA